MTRRWYRPTGRNIQVTPPVIRAWQELATLAIAIGRHQSSDWDGLRLRYDKVRSASAIGIDTKFNCCRRLRRAVFDAITPRDRHYWTYDQFVEYGEDTLRACAISQQLWDAAFKSAG